MACYLSGAKALSETMWNIVDLTLRNKLQWNVDQNNKFSCMKMHLKISSVKWWPFCPWGRWVNSLRPRQNGRHFADVFKRIFLNDNVWISLKISLKFVPKVPNNNFPALVQIMAWRRPGDKPLSGAMVASLLTHICVTRPQWVNYMTWLGQN